MARLAPTESTLHAARWLDCVVDSRQGRGSAPLLGVLPGEGIGPEVVDAALNVVRGLERAGGRAVSVEIGGPIGREAERTSGVALTEDVVRFCEDVFQRGGAILSGPGGGRYVYDLRTRFDLFLKLTPLQVRNGLVDASPLRPETLEDVDLLLVRENTGGIYQGSSEEQLGDDGDRLVRHSFSYAEAHVQRFLDAAARLARARRRRLTVVTKEAGVPGVSALWCACAESAANEHGVAASLVDADLAAYELVHRPRDFDVVAAPNLYGDVLGDLAAVLVGSRGLSYSGNFSPRGDAVYQTNHGAAYDIAGADRADPVGQILSAAMLLRESLGLEPEAWAIEEGVRRVWSRGLRTADLNGGAEDAVGTTRMAALVAEAAAGCLAASRERA